MYFVKVYATVGKNRIAMILCYRQSFTPYAFEPPCQNFCQMYHTNYNVTLGCSRRIFIKLR